MTRMEIIALLIGVLLTTFVILPVCVVLPMYRWYTRRRRQFVAEEGRIIVGRQTSTSKNSTTLFSFFGHNLGTRLSFYTVSAPQTETTRTTMPTHPTRPPSTVYDWVSETTLPSYHSSLSHRANPISPRALDSRTREDAERASLAESTLPPSYKS